VTDIRIDPSKNRKQGTVKINSYLSEVYSVNMLDKIPIGVFLDA